MGIVSGGGGSGGAQTVLTASLSLTSAQVKQLFTTPVQIVAAPGAGLAAFPITGYAFITGVGTPYTTAGANEFAVDNAGGVTRAGLLEIDTSFLQSTVDSYASLISGNQPLPVNADNKALVVKVFGANPAAGDGVVKVYLTYYIATL